MAVSTRLWAQGCEHKAMGTRLWVQGCGHKDMDTRLWAQGYGHKAIDARLWVQGCGHTIICVYSIVSFVPSNRRNVGEVGKETPLQKKPKSTNLLA